MVIFSFIAVLYAVTGHFVYSTIGEPYATALAEKKAVALDEWWDNPWEDLDTDPTAAQKPAAADLAVDADGEPYGADAESQSPKDGEGGDAGDGTDEDDEQAKMRAR